jgi:CheY-like chemotaxis protein
VNIKADVLLIEDNAILQEMIVRKLTRLGYRCDVAADGYEGIEQVARQKPAIVLLDMTLPDTDGRSVAQQIKSRPESKNIPVIAITAQAMVGDRETALSAGCDDYMTKPIDFDALHRAMQRLLGTSGS